MTLWQATGWRDIRRLDAWHLRHARIASAPRRGHPPRPLAWIAAVDNGSVSAVPEPAGWALMLAGIALLGH